MYLPKTYDLNAFFYFVWQVIGKQQRGTVMKGATVSHLQLAAAKGATAGTSAAGLGTLQIIQVARQCPAIKHQKVNTYLYIEAAIWFMYSYCRLLVIQSMCSFECVWQCERRSVIVTLLLLTPNLFANKMCNLYREEQLATRPACSRFKCSSKCLNRLCIISPPLLRSVRIFFFFSDFIFKKTLFEKLQKKNYCVS